MKYYLNFFYFSGILLMKLLTLRLYNLNPLKGLLDSIIMIIILVFCLLECKLREIPAHMIENQLYF